MVNLTESNQQLLLLLEKCCDTSATPESGCASSIDASSPPPHLNDDAGFDGTITDNDAVTPDLRLAHYREEIRQLRAQLHRLHVSIKSVVIGSAECMKYWVDKATDAEAELNRLSSQSSTLVPIKSILDGSATCVKPWVDKLNDTQAELDRLSSQLADSVPIKSVIDGSAECARPWVEMAGQLQDQSAKIQDLEDEKTRLQSRLNFQEKQLKRADEEVCNLLARLGTGELKPSKQAETLREQAQSSSPNLPVPRLQRFKTKYCRFWLEGRCWNGDRCTYAHAGEELRPPDLAKTTTFSRWSAATIHSEELQSTATQVKLAKANETITRLNVTNMSLQQCNADLRMNNKQLKQSLRSTDHSDHPEVSSLEKSFEVPPGLSESADNRPMAAPLPRINNLECGGI